MRKIGMLSIALAVALAAYAFGVDQAANAQGAMPAGVKASKLANGTTVLVDAKGMTLYTYAKDAGDGKSVCNGGCAKNWPPLSVAADAKATGDWTIVTRDDGMKQWAYKTKPLYGWVKDAKPGDTTGDGAGGGSWKLATP